MALEKLFIISAIGVRLLENVFAVPVEELFDTPGIVAEDIVDDGGSILLPLGTQLSWLEKRAGQIIDRLKQSGIKAVLVRREKGLTTEELRELLAQAKPPVRTIGKKLAGGVVDAIGKVYRSIASGQGREELLSPLLAYGKTLSREIGRNPSILFSLLKVRERDEYTFIHSLNVSLVAGSLAGSIRPGNDPFLEQIVTASLLHDLGKAHITPAILNKPERLTEEEFDQIRRHPEAGERLAHEAGIIEPAILQAIRWHHEKWEGTGYPDRLRAEVIPLPARITAVADVFDALTAERAYKGAMPPREALSLIIEASGVHFDPAVSGHLLRSMGLFPPGTIVELSDDSLAVVVSLTRGDLMRPTVLVQLDGRGKPLQDIRLIDLRRSPHFIRKALSHLGKAAV